MNQTKSRSKAKGSTPTDTLTRYQLRELERMVEKTRHQFRVAAAKSDFEEFDTYVLLLREARAAHKQAKTPAAKDWALINQLAAKLELRRVTGEDCPEGVRSILPAQMLPPDPFPFGDRSL